MSFRSPIREKSNSWIANSVSSSVIYRMYTESNHPIFMFEIEIFSYELVVG